MSTTNHVPPPSASTNGPANYRALRAINPDLGAVAYLRWLFTDGEGHACPQPLNVIYAEMELEGYTGRQIYEARMRLGAKQHRLGTRFLWLWPRKMMGVSANYVPKPWTGQMGECNGRPVWHWEMYPLKDQKQ